MSHNAVCVIALFACAHLRVMSQIVFRDSGTCPVVVCDDDGTCLIVVLFA